MTIDLSKLNYTFTKKPLVVGGTAMEYYGLRKAGDDIDLLASAEDVAELVRLYPKRIKDLWGDIGVCPYEFEIWKSIKLLGYTFLSEGAQDLGNYLMISLDKLLLMKTDAILDKEKYLNDTKLIVKRMLYERYKAYNAYKAENTALLKNVKGIEYIERKGPSV